MILRIDILLINLKINPSSLYKEDIVPLTRQLRKEYEALADDILSGASSRPSVTVDDFSLAPEDQAIIQVPQIIGTAGLPGHPDDIIEALLSLVDGANPHIVTEELKDGIENLQELLNEPNLYVASYVEPGLSDFERNINNYKGYIILGHERNEAGVFIKLEKPAQLFQEEKTEFRDIIIERINHKITALRQLTPEQVEEFVRAQLYKKEEQARGNIRRQMTVEPVEGSDAHTVSEEEALRMRFENAPIEVRRLVQGFVSGLFRNAGIPDIEEDDTIEGLRRRIEAEQAQAMTAINAFARTNGIDLGGDEDASSSHSSEVDEAEQRAGFESDTLRMLENIASIRRGRNISRSPDTDTDSQDTPEDLLGEDWLEASAALRRFISDNIGITRLVLSGNMSVGEVQMVFNYSPPMLLAIAEPDVIALMDTDLVSFEDSVRLYDENPAMLTAISTSDVRLMLENEQATFDQVCEVYNQSPAKLIAISALEVRRMIDLQNVPFERISALYDRSPRLLNEMSSIEVRLLPEQQFQERLEQELAPQRASVGGFNVPAPGTRFTREGGQGRGSL